MTETTANLDLPYILPAQAQKHVTHNEALQKLDAIVQLTITDEATSPPAIVTEGDCYHIADGATGLWQGKQGMLAFRQDEGWLFLSPKNGWQAWLKHRLSLSVFADGQWQDAPLPAHGSFSFLGIAATPDENNRFSLASPASLFNHRGAGHQVKINKAGETDTASLLFQSDWKGHAEMGIAGNNDFSVKVSGDGENWLTAMAIRPDGVLTTPQRPLVCAGRSAATINVSAGSRCGFSTLSTLQGGFSLGNTVAGGTGQELIVPADGIYLVILRSTALSSSGHSTTLLVNGTAHPVTLDFPATSQATSQSGTFILPLAKNDRLAFGYTGTAQIAFGPGKSELTLLFI